jgi:hypothetical protein
MRREGKTMRFALVLQALSATVALAAAGHAGAGDALSFDKFTLTPNVGTLGAGIEGGYRWNPYWGARIGLNGGGFGYTYHDNKSDLVNQVTLLNAGATADYYPFAGDFRVSAGVRLSANKVEGKMRNLKKTGKNYEILIDDPLTSYTVRQNAIQPYLGIGYAVEIKPRLSLTFDFGALYAGQPRLGVRSHAEEFGFTPKQIRDEIAHQRDRIAPFQVYPIAQIGLTFRF